MAKKVRMTVFSRFLLFMIIVVPAAYFGVSYAKGEDGLKNLKDAVGIETTVSNDSRKGSNDGVKTNSEISRLKDDLKEKEERIDELYLENEALKKKLRDQEVQLEQFKKKLDALFNG